MLFRLIEIELDGEGQVIAHRPTLPLFELRQDAMALGEFAAARRLGDYGYDADRDCWWAAGEDGRVLRFMVEPALDAA
jgi:hypothetical protein